MKIILNTTETQHNYRLYLNSLKRYKTFQEELECKSGRSVQLLMSGSVAENLFAIHWVYKDGRREASNDIDVMLVYCSMEVVEKDQLESSDMLDKEIETGLDMRENAAIKSQLFDIKAECSLHASENGQSTKPKSPSTPTPLAQHEGQVEVEAALEDKSKHAKKHVLLVPTTHLGYVRLIGLDEEGNTTYLTAESFKGFWSEVVNKTALYSLVSGPQLPPDGVVVSGPALSRRDRPGRRNNYAHDYVPCLHCAKWTTLADKWADRKRAADWPKRGLISEIVSEGCHVVPISHYCDSGDDFHETEWRLSFSNAEKKLVDTLMTGQRQSYIMAKLIMKQVIQEMKDSSSYLSVEKVPSSYHLKTIFLWKCEEKPLKEWNNLLESVVDLLKNLVDHLRKGNIPQYFIPENNLIDDIKQNVLGSVADGIMTAINDLPTILHHVFLAAYNTQLDYDERVSPILRLMECQLKIFCTKGIAGDKLYLYCILNSLIDSLSAATVGTSDESRPLEDHKYILNIYHLCHSTAGNAVTLLSLPVLGAAEEHAIVILLFRYLWNLLQNTHILTVLQTDVFAFMARLFTQNLVSLSVKEKVFTECCEASLNLYLSVCEKLGVAQDSDLSCREELSTLNGIDFIFYKNTEITKKECFQFVANRFKKFQENLNTVKTLSW